MVRIRIRAIINLKKVFDINILVHKNAMMFYNVDDKIKQTKKVVREDYDDPNQFQNDLVDQLDRQNNKRFKFVYSDGKKRAFGQKLKIRNYMEFYNIS